LIRTLLVSLLLNAAATANGKGVSLNSEVIICQNSVLIYYSFRTKTCAARSQGKTDMITRKWSHRFASTAAFFWLFCKRLPLCVASFSFF